jgi:hypothetical protein
MNSPRIALRTMTALLTCAVLGTQAACGSQPGTDSPGSASPTADVSASCLAALKDRLARAPYDPFAPYAGRIKSCANEPADAYAATVQRLLREAQDATPSPDTSRRP